LTENSVDTAPPDVIEGRKVFCIGLNKTGTSSFGAAMRLLDYKVLGWTGFSATLTLRWHEGHFGGEAKRAIAAHDAFEDLPWGLWYREIDELVPDALFVLTERATPAIWLDSIQRHIARGSAWVGHYLVYGSYDPVGDSDKYLARYIAHAAEVEAYFANRPGKLLTVSWDRGDGWTELCRFLGHPSVPEQPFPHINQAPQQEPEYAG